jgi:hypothetical protein
MMKSMMKITMAAAAFMLAAGAEAKTAHVAQAKPV